MQEPNRPALTPAQLVAVLIAGIPAVAKLLEAFGAYTLTAAQQDALTGALTWLGVLAGVLIGADAALRSARNAAHAKVAASAPKPPAPQPFVATGQPAGNTVSALTWTEPHPGMAVTNPVTPPTTPDPGSEIPGGGLPPEDAS